MNSLRKTADKCHTFWRSLDKKITVNKRELVLCVIIVALVSFILGMLLTPRKNTVIGSNNTNNGSNNTEKRNDSDDRDDDTAED